MINYKFKLEDVVKSKWNTYSKNTPGVVDRIFTKKDGQKMIRIKFYYKGEEKLINVPESSCEIDVSQTRNEKLNKLFDE